MREEVRRLDSWDFATTVLPWDSPNGGLLMITGYFDDSGTHDTSEIVLVGGLLGNQYQWQYFNELWASQLREPVPGKFALSRFHMTECQARRGEFDGWNTEQVEFLVRQLTDIIIRCGLWGYGCGVARDAWNDLVTGDDRDALGDAEGNCVRDSNE